MTNEASEIFFFFFCLKGFRHHEMSTLYFCLFVCLVLFYDLIPPPRDYLSTQRLDKMTRPRPLSGHHGTWRYCQQCIVSFSRTIYIFLKWKKKNITSNIYEAFLKSGFNGIWTTLFFLPYLYVVVLVPNKMSVVHKYALIVWTIGGLNVLSIQ